MAQPSLIFEYPMTIEYLTLGAYFIILLVVGALFSRFNHGMSDFVRGGARGTWWMVGTSMLMAGISAFTFTGNGSAAFDAGPTLLAIYVANVLGFVLGGLFLAKWYRQTRAYTAADVIRQRFGPAVEQFNVVSLLLTMPFQAAVQLWALGMFVSAVFGFPLVATIVVIGVITVTYSAFGGMWGVMATDVVQGIIMYGMTILVAVLCLVEIGGVGAFFSYFNDPRFAESFTLVKEPGQFAQDKFTWGWVIVIFFMQLLTQINLSTATKYLAVKDGREATRAAWWGGALMTIGAAVWFLPPMVARFLYEAEVLALPIKDPSSAAYAVAAQHVLPNGLMGVMIAAMFSATMSSMDMGLSNQTGIIVRNLLPAWRRRNGTPEPDEVHQLRLCRGITAGLGALIIAASVTLAMQDKFVLFDAFILLASVIGTPLGMPLIVGLVLRRLPSWGYVAIFGGSLLPSLWSLLDERLTGAVWTAQERGGWVLVGGVVATLLCLPFRKSAPAAQREREDAFFAQMQTPVDFEKEIGGSIDGRQAILTGRILMVLAALLLLFLFVPNTPMARVAILGLVAFVATAGGLLWRAGRKA